MDRPTLLNHKWRAGYAAARLAGFTDRCQQRGLAITPQRVAVMRVLVTSGDHPRAEHRVRQGCASDYPNISLATVHRTLRDAVRDRRGAQGHPAARQRAL